MKFFQSLFYSLKVWWFTLHSTHHNQIITKLQLAGAQITLPVFIGPHVYVEMENAALLTIEAGTVIADFTKIILHDSSLNNVIGDPILFGKVILRQNCYIGADCIILPGTEVGKNTLVGAGSLVKGHVKANSVYVGRSARRISSIAQLSKKWRTQKSSLIQFVPSPRWYQRTATDIAQLDAKKLKF